MLTLNVNPKMGTADEHIRVSERVKRAIERRRREGESYNDVLERTLAAGDVDTERDLLAGAGFWSDETADRARETREAYKKRSKERTKRRTGAGDEGDADEEAGR